MNKIQRLIAAQLEGVIDPEYIANILLSPSEPLRQFHQVLNLLFDNLRKTEKYDGDYNDNRDLSGDGIELTGCAGEITGGIILFSGPMRGGKTLFALATGFAAAHHFGLNLVFLKSCKDTRNPKSIASASGLSSNSHLPSKALEESIKTVIFGSSNKQPNLSNYQKELINTDLLIIDEVLFCTEAELRNLLKIVTSRKASGKWTIISTLDKDFRGKPMRGYSEFLGLEPIEVKTLALCELCDLPAKFTQRDTKESDLWVPSSPSSKVISAEGKQEERYGCRCKTHHTSGQDKVFQLVKRGSRFLSELEELISKLECPTPKDPNKLLKTKSVLFRKWDNMTSKNQSLLTVYENALLIRLANLYSASSILHDKLPQVPLLCLEGVPGVGKTTLLNHLSAKHTFPIIQEDTELNYWLSYSIGGTISQKKSTAFSSQLFYRLSKLSSLVSHLSKFSILRDLGAEYNPIIVSDRWIYPGDQAFIEHNHEQGFITDYELSLLNRVNELFSNPLPIRKYIALLSTDISSIYTRAVTRGRSFESVNDKDSFFEWISALDSHTSKLLSELPANDNVIAEIDATPKTEDIANILTGYLRLWDITL